MKYRAASVFLSLALPTVAFAQGQPSGQPSPSQLASILTTTASVDFNHLTESMGRAFRDLSTLAAENESLQRDLDNLKAYLKACGDKPGCTQPAAEHPSP